MLCLVFTVLTMALNSLLLPCNNYSVTWHSNKSARQLVFYLTLPYDSKPLRHNQWRHIPSDLMAFHTLHTLSSHTNLLGYAAKPQAASKWAKLPAKCAQTCIKKQQFPALLHRMLPESTIFPTETKNMFVSPWRWRNNSSKCHLEKLKITQWTIITTHCQWRA